MKCNCVSRCVRHLLNGGRASGNIVAWVEDGMESTACEEPAAFSKARLSGICRGFTFFFFYLVTRRFLLY
jgi:hypothetical protein